MGSGRTSTPPHLIQQKKIRQTVTWWLIVVIHILAGVGSVQAETTITIKGSDTMVILAQKWAEVYMAKNPNVKIQVTGGGSGTGFAALQNQTTDLATASRSIRARESAACIKIFRRRPKEIRVCLDGLSVYVHKANPIQELSLDDLADIFTGRVKNWKRFGGLDAPITIYSRENSSGTYEFFKENVINGRDFTAKAQSMPGTAAVLQAVSKDQNGIGYGGAAYGLGAKPLRIKRRPGDRAFAPNEEHVRSRDYPIWRYLYIYVDPNQYRGPIAQFLDWIQGAEGQSVVGQVGYFPLASADNWIESLAQSLAQKQE